jgi:hypothetical protein
MLNNWRLFIGVLLGCWRWFLSFLESGGHLLASSSPSLMVCVRKVEGGRCRVTIVLSFVGTVGTGVGAGTGDTGHRTQAEQAQAAGSTSE